MISPFVLLYVGSIIVIIISVYILDFEWFDSERSDNAFDIAKIIAMFIPYFNTLIAVSFVIFILFYGIYKLID